MTATVWDVTEARQKALYLALEVLTTRRAVARVYESWPETKEMAQRDIALIDEARNEIRSMLEESEVKEVEVVAPPPVPIVVKRIQRQRVEGWRMPENACYVGRPTQWGNPYDVRQHGRERAVEMYRGHVASELARDPKWLDSLRGKDLACWCALDQACHADILLEILNAQTL